MSQGTSEAATANPFARIKHLISGTRDDRKLQFDSASATEPRHEGFHPAAASARFARSPLALWHSRADEPPGFAPAPDALRWLALRGGSAHGSRPGGEGGGEGAAAERVHASDLAMAGVAARAGRLA